MPERISRRNDLDQVRLRFPRQANTVRPFDLAGDAFRGACEDYARARRVLVAFETRTDAAEPPEIADSGRSSRILTAN